MKKFIAFALILHLCGLSALAQATAPQTTTPQQAPPTTKKVIIQTLFGPKEVDAPADAPPQTPAPSPTAAPAPATPSPNPSSPAAAAPAPVQTGPPTTTSVQTPDGPAVAMNFNNQDLYGVITLICGQLNLNCIIDPTIKGTVNIDAAEGLHRSDLLPVLETILKMNGDTMIHVGNFWEVVPATSAVRQPLEVQERQPLVNPDDQMVLQIIRMKFVPATEMKNLLTPYLSEGASINIQEAGNILLITERRSNLRKLLQLVDIFDANVFTDERVRVYPIKNNLASTLVPDLNNIFSGYGLTQGNSAIHFTPIDRLNSLLVISPNPTVFSLVQEWIDRLDQTIPNGGITTHVYPVRNAKAMELGSLLNQLYGNPLQTTGTTNQSGGTVFAPPQNQPPVVGPMGSAVAAPSAATTPSVITTGGTRPNIRIIADAVHNTLIIQAVPQVYQEVERLIEQLDILPRQVMIDAQVFEVTLDDSLSFGLTAALQSRNGTSTQTTASFTGPSGSPPALSAQAAVIVGANAIVGYLNASENRSKVKTLSAPTVLVSDNVEANFQVGANVPVPTSSSVTPVTSSGTNLFAQTISYTATGVILHVKPQINDGGNVTLEVDSEVSDAEPNTTSAVVAPVIGLSTVKSTVIVQDGQTIAIGGFIQDHNEVDRSEIPILGRIPYLGNLFGTTSRTASRTELIVLITPHVLRTHEDADAATEELKAKLKEVQKLLK